MPLTKSQSKKYKKALQPENIKKGLAQDEMYLHTLYTNLMREGNYDYSKTTPLIELLQVKGKEAGVRYGAVDDFVFGYDLDPLLKVLKVENIQEITGDRPLMSREDLARNNQEVINKLMEEGVGKEPIATPPESEEDTPNLRGATKRMEAFEDPKEGEKVTPQMTSPEGVTATTYPVKTTNTSPEQRQEQKSNVGGDIQEAEGKRKEAEARLEATLESIPGDIPPMEKVIPPVDRERKNVEMNISNSGRGVENSVSKVEGGGGPTIYDTIPKEKLITEGKSVNQLKMDILYFFKRFSKELKNVKVDRKNNNLAYLQAKHKEIVAKLKAGQTEKPTEKVGVIISAPDFIKQKLKEIILENTINGLTIQDMIINIEGKEAQQSSDTGKYEFKEGPDGKPRAKEEPIYRHIPEVNTSQSQRMKARIPNTATKYRGLEQTAKQEVRQNPFSKPQKTIRLKYSY